MSVIKPTEMLRDTEGAKGTPLYMAPEIMLQEEYDEKADVYRWVSLSPILHNFHNNHNS